MRRPIAAGCSVRPVRTGRNASATARDQVANAVGSSNQDVFGNRQTGSQARRLDAEQVHQPGDAMLRRAIDAKVRGRLGGPLIFGRMPV